jgi:hypothetical protein
MVNEGLGFAVYIRVEKKHILCDFGFLMILRVPLLHVQIHYYRQKPTAGSISDCCLLHAGFFLGLRFDPKDEDDIFP